MPDIAIHLNLAAAAPFTCSRAVQSAAMGQPSGAAAGSRRSLHMLHSDSSAEEGPPTGGSGPSVQDHLRARTSDTTSVDVDVVGGEPPDCPSADSELYYMHALICSAHSSASAPSFSCSLRLCCAVLPDDWPLPETFTERLKGTEVTLKLGIFCYALQGWWRRIWSLSSTRWRRSKRGILA